MSTTGKLEADNVRGAESLSRDDALPKADAGVRIILLGLSEWICRDCLGTPGDDCGLRSRFRCSLFDAMRWDGIMRSLGGMNLRRCDLMLD